MTKEPITLGSGKIYINEHPLGNTGGCRTTIPTNCPNCGAVIDIQAERCAYCDTPYVWKSQEAHRYTVHTDVDVLAKAVESALLTPNEVRKIMGRDMI